MDAKWSPIDRWPSESYHIRNIEISLEVCKGKTYRAVAKLYGISSSRVEQVYRITAAKICEREFNVPYIIASFDKKWTRHKDIERLIREYQSNYISWITGGKNGEHKEKA